MRKKEKKYYLNDQVLHVQGAANNALYDTSSGAVYSLTGEARAIVNSIEASRYSPDEENRSFIKALLSMNLITYSSKKQSPLKIQEKPIKLRQMWLALNSNCNLKCSHCYADSEPGPSDFSLSNEIIFNAVKDGVNHYGLEFVQFIGGEPLLLGLKKLRQLIEGIKHIGIKEIEIYTNGMPITKKHIELFKEFNISIAVSMYSYRSQEHDAITQYKGSWKRTIANVDSLHENNIKLRFGVVIMEENKDIADEIKPWLIKRYGNETNVGLDVVRTCGRGNNVDTVPWQNFQDVHIRKDKKSFLPATISTLETTLYSNICWGGLVCIHPNGDISPCEMEFESIQGNLNNNSLHEIISGNHDIGQSLSKDKIELCNQCEYRYVCWECRAMANTLGEHKNHKPITCMYDPLTGVWQKTPSKQSFFKTKDSNQTQPIIFHQTWPGNSGQEAPTTSN